MMHRDGTASGRSLIINGGNLKVNAVGDGLDSNGAILMNSGTVVVYGPENDGNAALDYDETFTINGGTLIAFGSAGMAQNVSEGSKQSAVLIGLSSVQVAGSTFSISDAKGNKIINLISDKDYNSVLVSTADLKLNTAYTYSANDVQL